MKKSLELSQCLEQGVPPEQILKVLRESLSADLVARDGSRQPDHRTRIEASKLILAYSLGLPTQRTENVTVNVDADAALGLKERLKASPALRDSLRMMLENSEERESG